MSTFLHHPAGLAALQRYRVDTGATNGTAAVISRVDPTTGIDGSIVQADAAGQVSPFLGAAATLYLRPVDARGGVGTAVASTGAAFPTAAPAAGGALDDDLTVIGTIDSTQQGVLASDGAGWVLKAYAALRTAIGAAPLASPTLTGTPAAPTPSGGDNTTKIATTAFVAAAIANLVASAPGALDTLNELAAALGNDASFAATITALLAQKAPLVSPTLTGTPAAPTPTVGDNTTKIATTAFVKAALDALVASAPGALDTLNELAAALGNDANYAATTATALAARVSRTDTGTVDLSGATATVPATSTTKDAVTAATMGLWPPARQVFPQIRETVISAFQASHGWVKSGTGTASDDTTDFMLGSQSYKFVTDGAGGSGFATAPAATYNLTSKNLIIAVKVDDFTHYNDFQIRISSNNFTDFAYCKPVYSGNTQRWTEAGTWNIITISRAELVSGVSWGQNQWQYSGTKGNVDWSAITGIRLKFVDDAAAPCTFRINLLGHFPQPTTAVLSLMFDDSRATHYTVAKPYLDKYRLPATSAIIGESVLSGSSAYMTLAQLRSLRDSKWSIMCHAYSNATGLLAHANGYDGIPYADGEADVERLKHWMNANGFRGANLIALPHGTWSVNTPGVSNPNTDVLNMLRKYFDAVRTTESYTLETYPPADPMRLRSYTVASTNTAQNLLDVIDQGIVGKCHILMQWHNLVTPVVNSTDATPTVFQTFIDGIKTRSDAGTLLVRTLQEVLQYGMV